jgi:hypothetical protein
MEHLRITWGPVRSARSLNAAVFELESDQVRGRLLTLDEMLTDEFVAEALDEERYSWVDNSPAEISEVVEDMV